MFVTGQDHKPDWIFFYSFLDLFLCEYVEIVEAVNQFALQSIKRFIRLYNKGYRLLKRTLNNLRLDTSLSHFNQIVSSTLD